MLISIIVPVFNVENELPRCLNSLICQTYRNIEIILIDDGSTDSSPSICDAYSRKDARIKVIHKSNTGLSDTRNIGIQTSTGEYFLLVDSDDYIEADSCERFIEIIHNTNADIIVSNAIQERKDGVEYMRHTNLDEGKLYTNSEYLINAIKVNEWYAPACFNCYKKVFFLENNLEYKKGMLHEDMEILPRLFLSAKVIAYLDKTFYHYVVRDNSIMNSSRREINGTHLMKIYTKWANDFKIVKNDNLRKMLYGNLIKHFLHTCREYKIVEKAENIGIPSSYVVIFGLNMKEKIKGIIYLVAPRIYIKL